MEGFSYRLPKKSLFKSEEVCGLADIKLYVLKFWESEFSELSPIVTTSGQKMYEEKDIEIVFSIKKLLIEEKLTIEKARQRLTEILKNKGSKQDQVQEEEKSSSQNFSEFSIKATPQYLTIQDIQEVQTAEIQQKEEQKEAEKVVKIESIQNDVINFNKSNIEILTPEVKEIFQDRTELLNNSIPENLFIKSVYPSPLNPFEDKKGRFLRSENNIFSEREVNNLKKNVEELLYFIEKVQEKHSFKS